MASAAARSVLVRTSRSATATCLTLSGCASSCRAPFTASTVVITLPRQKWCRSTGSDRTVDKIGNGSAKPVLSMTRRRKGGSRPRSRRECKSLIAAESSPRMVQQTQPDCSITIASSMRSSSVVVETDFTEFVDDDGSA